MASKKALSSVLVVGGGVVGLTTALALARAGVPVTVLEAAPELLEEYRASTFHPPTLKMLDDLGLAEGMLAKGLVAPTFQFRDRREGLIAEFDLGLLKNDTRFPFRLQLEQHALAVAAYAELLRVPGATVRFGHEVTSVRLEDDRVVLSVSTAAGPLELSAPYVVGADGATSAVRRSLGIAFDGMTYPDRYLVLFTTFDFAKHFNKLSYVNYFSDAERWFVLLRSPGVWRLLFPTKAKETDRELELEEVAQEHLQRVVPTGEPYPILHRTLYSVHQRVAGKYLVGRVLLAGDAAHINHPLGGMGLNGGIHDGRQPRKRLVGCMARTCARASAWRTCRAAPAHRHRLRPGMDPPECLNPQSDRCRREETPARGVARDGCGSPTRQAVPAKNLDD